MSKQKQMVSRRFLKIARDIYSLNWVLRLGKYVLKENNEKEYEINKLWLNAQGNIKAFQMARFFLFAFHFIVQTYIPLSLNPINFFCLLYNGNVEEFDEKKM